MTNSITQFFPPDSGPLASLTRPVAVLRMNPEELSERIGIRFHTAHDDLDVLDWAQVVGLSGKAYALVHHRHSPKPGTEVVVRYDSVDPRGDLVDLLRGLKLSEDDLVWTAPDASALNPSISDQPRTTRRLPSRSRQGQLLLKVPPVVATRLRNVHGRGGFQSLLRALKKRVKDEQLLVTPTEVERLLSYSAELGMVGSRTRTPQRRVAKKASRKK